MKVIVLGAGIVGATTAWTLAQAGFDVLIIDRQPKPANETSKGNACLISPGHTQVWNTPKAPLMHLQNLWQKDPVSSANFFNNPGFLRWSLRFLKSCRSSVSERNSLLGLQLAKRSSELTREIIEQYQLNVSMTTRGSLYWCNTEKELIAEAKHCEFLNAQGVKARILDANQLLGEEPALRNSSRPFLGALNVHDDISASCPQFAQQLLERAVKDGKVKLITDSTITSIEHNKNRITRIETTEGRLEAEHFVLALGPESGIWAKTLGLTLPIAPAKGYSLTVSVNPNATMPRHAGVDLGSDVVVAPLTNQLRITSYANFEGFDRTWKASNFLRHQRVVEELLPGLVNWEEDKNEWAGLRPMTPDGIPVIGQAKPYSNMWFNTGHGYLGWTQAAASAEMLLQKMTGVKPDEFAAAFDLRW